MEGIEILNTVELTAAPNWTVACIPIVLILVLVAWFCLKNSYDQMRIWIGLILAICSFSLLIVATLCAIFGKKPTGEFHYQVTISEEVNFIEFNEKYEIIEQNGKIYTIRER